jgi:hypothetical protein
MKLTKPIPLLKSRAKKLKTQRGIPLGSALDEVAGQEGFSSWSHLVHAAGEKDPEGEIRETITSLPLNPVERREFVELAETTFDAVMERMEPENPEATRALWDAGSYVDGELSNILSQDLPISRDYALSLIEAFLVHHVLDLAVAADADAVES